MRTIITVTPGYLITVEAGGHRPLSRRRAGSDPQTAAATAMQCAVTHGPAYVIFGPPEVMSLIPADLQSRH